MSASPAPSSSNPFFTTASGTLTGTTTVDNADFLITNGYFSLTNAATPDFAFYLGDGGQYYDGDTDNEFVFSPSEIQVRNQTTNLGTKLNLTGIEFPDSTIQTTAATSTTFATSEETEEGTSTTTVISPVTLREMLMTSNVTKLNTGLLASTTGTGGTNDGAGYDFIRLLCPNSAANVITTRYRAVNMQKGSSLSANMSFANGVALQFRLSLLSTTGTDPNSTGVIAIGEGNVTTAVLPSVRSIGVQLNYGSNIKILAHDGTTLTTYTTSTSVASLYIDATDFLLTNDYATGTVTLYINGVSVGSTTGGVTSFASGFNARNNFNARAFNTSVPSGSQLGFIIYGATSMVL
jgi:hypothetical protein